MSTAIAAYLVAAALQIRYNLSPGEAVKRAADLWRLVSRQVQ